MRDMRKEMPDKRYNSGPERKDMGNPKDAVHTVRKLRGSMPQEMLADEPGIYNAGYSEGCRQRANPGTAKINVLDRITKTS